MLKEARRKEESRVSEAERVMIEKSEGEEERQVKRTTKKFILISMRKSPAVSTNLLESSSSRLELLQYQYSTVPVYQSTGPYNIAQAQ